MREINIYRENFNFITQGHNKNEITIIMEYMIQSVWFYRGLHGHNVGIVYDYSHNNTTFQRFFSQIIYLIL
jgi:hypothetical protein